MSLQILEANVGNQHFLEVNYTFCCEMLILKTVSQLFQLKMLLRDKSVAEEQNSREKEMLLHRLREHEHTIKEQHKHVRAFQVEKGAYSCVRDKTFKSER